MTREDLLIESYLYAILPPKDEFELLDEGAKELIKKNLGKIEKSFVGNIKTAKQFLKDKGANIKEIEKEGRSIGKIIKKGIDKKQSKEVIFKMVEPKVKSTLIKFGRAFGGGEDEERTQSEKIIRSLRIFLIILVFNSAFSAILIPFFGPLVATSILAITLAPVLEELGKNIAVTSGYPWIYTGIFAGIEGIMYVVMMVLGGIPVHMALIFRVIALTMHFLTTFIQVKSYENKKYSGEEISARKGYIAGVLIHLSYNFIATLPILMKGV